MTEVFTVIGNFGFPIAVAGYLLFRFEKKIEALNTSIDGKDGLTTQISALKGTIKDLCREVRELKK